MKRFARMAFATSFLLANLVPTASTFADTKGNLVTNIDYTYVYLTAEISDEVKNDTYTNDWFHYEVEGNEKSAAVQEIYHDLICQAEAWLGEFVEEGAIATNVSNSSDYKLSYSNVNSDGVTEKHFGYHIIFSADIVSDDIVYLKDLDFTVTEPTVGDEASAENHPVVTNNTEGTYTVDNAKWVQSSEENAEEFAGTFASDSTYYAQFTVTPTDGAKLSKDLSVTIDGEAPAALYKTNEQAKVVVEFKTDASPVDTPTEPTDPTDPAEPTGPTEPTDPTDPTIPTEPTDPTGPTDPADEPTPGAYVIIDGGNSTYIYGQEEGISIHVSGPLESFLNLLMDGEVVDASNYTLSDGSTIVDFNKEYLESLSEGVHNISFVYDDGGEVTTTLIVKKEPAAAPDSTTTTTPSVTNPQTDDSLARDFVILAFSTIGLIGAAVCLGKTLK